MKGKLIAFGLFFLVLALPRPAGLSAEAHRLAAVTALMAALWLTQVVPLAVTSLIPLVAFPLLGIQSAQQVSKAYVNESVFLLLGGFIIALGIEKWGLHRRVALYIVRLVGTSLKRTILGFMLSTAFLSMWISNTASTLLMLPIALGFVESLREAAAGKATTGSPPGTRGGSVPDTSPAWQQLSVVLLLGIAYSASIGGFTTQVGTPANVQFRIVWADQFPRAPEISNGEWMIAVFPIGVVMLTAAWCLLTWRLPKVAGQQRIDRNYFSQRIAELGPPQRAEILMSVVFLLAAVLWISRKSVTVGNVTLLPGWETLVEYHLLRLGTEPNLAAGAVGDSTVAILMALVMFFVPAKRHPDGRLESLMDWATAQQLPWAILLLIGGGFALAAAFSITGLSRFLGDRFAEHAGDWPPWLLVAGVCLLLTFLTELTSNVATVSALLPVLAGTAIAVGIDPRLIMIPATLATTCAFMLPIGTPPNAVVFASGKVRMGQMARYGFALNLVGVLVITLAAFTYLAPRLGIAPQTMPDWAVPAADADQGRDD